MKETIKEFLESDEESMPLPMTPLSDVDTIVLDLGYEHHDFEQNGWQVDLWQTWRGANNNELILAGSLQYGGFSLSKGKF